MGLNETMRAARTFLTGALALMAAAVFSGCSEEDAQNEGYTDSMFFGTWKCAYVLEDDTWNYISETNFAEYNATFRFFTNGICICEGPLTGDLLGTFERTDDLLTIFDGSRVAYRLTFHRIMFDIAVLTIEKNGSSLELRMERTDHTAQEYVPSKEPDCPSPAG